MSVQCDLFAEITSYDEKCLNLNVFTHSINDPLANSPVIVVIHGGGFMYGSSDDSYCGPNYLIQKNIVLVTANYRLGILGKKSFEMDDFFLIIPSVTFAL